MFQIRNKNFLFKNIFRNQNIFLWRHKKTPKAKVDFRGLNVHSEKISAWRTGGRGGRPSGRTARVFELFSLDTPGFSGFLPLSYPVCGP